MTPDHAPVPIVATLDSVAYVARLAGVGLDGLSIEVDTTSAFRGSGLCGIVNADGSGFTLFVDAFASIRQLAATLGHERTHVYQYAVFGAPTDTAVAIEFEAAAIASETAYLHYLDGTR